MVLWLNGIDFQESTPSTPLEKSVVLGFGVIIQKHLDPISQRTYNKRREMGSFVRPHVKCSSSNLRQSECLNCCSSWGRNWFSHREIEPKTSRMSRHFWKVIFVLCSSLNLSQNEPERGSQSGIFKAKRIQNENLVPNQHKAQLPWMAAKNRILKTSLIMDDNDIDPKHQFAVTCVLVDKSGIEFSF